MARIRRGDLLDAFFAGGQTYELLYRCETDDPNDMWQADHTCLLMLHLRRFLPHMTMNLRPVPAFSQQQDTDSCIRPPASTQIHGHEQPTEGLRSRPHR